MESSVLAIETSTVLLGVAVAVGETVLFHEYLEGGRIHSSRLLPLCERALSETGISLADLGGVAFSSGPGSFTGLRVGAATAQGLCHAWGKPVLMVPTFLALAYGAVKAGSSGHGADMVAAVQGRQGAQTVGVLYEDRGEGMWDHERFVPVFGPSPTSITEFSARIRKVGSGRVAIAGDAGDLLLEATQGAQDEGNLLPREGEGAYEKGSSSPDVAWVGADRSLPSAAVVAVIGGRMLARGEGVTPDLAIPMYYRRSQAEIKNERGGQSGEGERGYHR